MKGQIIKIIRDQHIVSYDGNSYSCKCRGKIRNKKIAPLVGDYCIFDKDKLIIEEILERKNEFQRPQVCNVDQAIIVISVKKPVFSVNLLDKFIITMELHGIESIICLTKEDISEEDELNKVYKYLKYYEKIGYKVISNKNLQDILNVLPKKTTVLTGQTGAGKSTLLNRLNPNLKLETGEISEALGRGKHTTRVVSLFELNGGKILDTPGFSALDFNDFSKEEIKESFIEFTKFDCPFRDCSHTNEKECSIKQAVNNKEILEERYNDYIKFMEKR